MANVDEIKLWVLSSKTFNFQTKTRRKKPTETMQTPVDVWLPLHRCCCFPRFFFFLVFTLKMQMIFIHVEQYHVDTMVLVAAGIVFHVLLWLEWHIFNAYFCKFLKNCCHTEKLMHLHSHTNKLFLSLLCALAPEQIQLAQLAGELTLFWRERTAHTHTHTCCKWT